MLSADQSRAITVHLSDFIPNAARTNFNGFEGIVPAESAPPLYTEDGITVQQINGDGNDIWAAYAIGHSGYEGTRAWYPDGGDNGYTKITRSNGSPFISVGFRQGSGLHPPPFLVDMFYELYDDGAIVLAGRFAHFLNHQVGYLGFSGGGFDEIRIRDGLTYQQSETYTLAESFYDGSINALAIDSIELSLVPEPASVSLLYLGVLACIFRWLTASCRPHQPKFSTGV